MQCGGINGEDRGVENMYSEKTSELEDKVAKAERDQKPCLHC